MGPAKWKTDTNAYVSFLMDGGKSGPFHEIASFNLNKEQ